MTRDVSGFHEKSKLPYAPICGYNLRPARILPFSPKRNLCVPTNYAYAVCDMLMWEEMPIKYHLTAHCQ